MDHALHLALHLAPWRFTPSSWLARRPGIAARPAHDPLENLHSLDTARLLRVESPLGREVVCVQGALWITHDGDPKDIVVAAGRSYVAERHAPLVVYALDTARFLIHPAMAEEA